MSEERVYFDGEYRLEGMFGLPEPRSNQGGATTAGEIEGGVVVAHPYPPNGADMDLPLIHHTAKCCRQRGFATLRFNFRSVGASGGSFSGTDESDDVVAAVSFLKERLTDSGGGRADKHKPRLGLAGWSFGSAMAARAIADLPEVGALALVGFVPGWEYLPDDTLQRLGRFAGPVLAICAQNDHIDSPENVERVLGDLGLDYRLQVVRDADHYLGGRHREVAQSVADFFASELAGA